MIFHDYPYTNFHDLNLDWILKMMKLLDKKMADLIAVNQITWAGEWSGSKAYPRWSIVQDTVGNGYISIQPVPEYVTLDNEEYWMKVADYDTLYQAFGDRITELEEKTDDLQDQIDAFDIDLAFTTPEENGAVGDGVTDDRAAIQAAIDTGKPVLFKKGAVYAISLDPVTFRGLMIPSGAVLDLNGATIKLIPAGYTSYTMLHMENASQVEIFGGVIYGDKEVNNTSNEWCYGIFGRGCSNIYIHDLTVKYSSGDGIEFGDVLCKNIHVYNVLCDNNGRNGLSITNADGVFISNSIFSNASGHNPQEGVDIEANTSADVLKNIHISNCSMKGNVHAGINVLSLADGDSVFISGCDVDCSIMVTIRGDESNVHVSHCTVRAYDFTSYGAEWSYGVGSGLYGGCPDTSRLTFDDITVDCSATPAYVFAYGEGTVMPGRYNIIAKEIKAVNGSVDRWILNRGAAPHSCSIEIFAGNVVPSSASENFITLVGGETDYTVTIHGRHEFTQRSGGTLGAYGDEMVATVTEGNNITLLYQPANTPIKIYNKGSAEFGIVGDTFIDAAGTAVSRVALSVDHGVEMMHDTITGNYAYKYI